ncbi:hypothetical protein V493_00291 [Pseudogymnoascus sp. VKM F-4281 (FW-2241)]|nr:hypothetical protein V493_00291 [Pseudogymnoascus sp. VKM F-4281 (FW-2241)]
MSSLPQQNYMDESPGMMGGPSLYFEDEEPLFPTPISEDGMLHFHEQHWANPQAMTGNNTSLPPWQVSVEMTRNDSSGTNQTQLSNQAVDFSTAPAAQTTTLPTVELPIQNSSSPSPGSLLGSTPPRGMRPRKRKSSPLTEEDEEDDGTPETPPRPPLKKTAHNMIEKRYRTNLNDKIAALRQSVPSLRATEKTLGGKGSRKMAEMIEDLDGLIPPNKLNKATILSKATEYIGHLERRNQGLIGEKKSLIDRITTFENLLLGRKQLYHPDQLLLQHRLMMEHGDIDGCHTRN